MSKKRKINSPLRHLGFVPFAMPDESPISIVKRATATNGFRDCTQLMVALSQNITPPKKQNQSILATNESFFAHRAVSLALQPCAPNHNSEIASGFYRATNSITNKPDTIIKGITIKHRIIRYTAAFCSECFKAGYEHFPRDIKLFTNCPYHNCGFIDECSFCSEKLHWQTLLTNRCKCGQLLTSPSRLTADMANDHYLLQLMNSRSDYEINLIQKIFNALDLATTHQTDPVRTTGIRDLAIAISRADIDKTADIFPLYFSCTSRDNINLTTGILENYLNQDQINSIKTLLTNQTLNIDTPPPAEELTQSGLISCLHITESKWKSAKNKLLSEKLFSTSKIYDIKTAITIQKVFKAQHKDRSNLDITKKLDTYGHILSLEQASKQTGLSIKAVNDLCRNTKNDLAATNALLAPSVRQLSENGIFETSMKNTSAANCSHSSSTSHSKPLNRK